MPYETEIQQFVQAIPSWKAVVDVLSALLSPVVAITTVYIAWKQWKLARQKSKLDLYNKRFETYSAVMRFISLMCRNGECNDSEYFTFLREATQHSFLFKKDVQSYVELLGKKAQETTALKKQIEQRIYRGVTSSEIELRRKEEYSNWFADQSTKAKELFGQYLEVKDL